MTFRWLALAPLVFGVLSAVQLGCAPPLGRVLVTVVFENETRTQCIKSTARNASGASINSNPASLPRDGKDTLRIGLGETADLVGEVQVTISRFSTADCAGTAFDTETQSVNVARGAPIATLEFRFVGMAADAGMDAGVDAGTDGGVDAGCDVGACGNAPGECEVAPAVACNNDGGCRYAYRVAQTPCGDGGVCNSMGACLANVCAVLPPNSPCDDQLPCTQSSTCVSGMCQGSCPAPPQCKLPMPTPSCDPNNMSVCELRNAANGGGCGPANFCLSGTCVPWVPFVPLNFPFTLETVPYPMAPWNLASPDGGLCDTVISTSGATPMALQSDCGSPSLMTSALSDAGAMLITATGLDLGPNARLHFVGDKPVQLLVLGNASIRGIVSVAPLLTGQLPAGSASALCTTPSAGSAAKEGGGGGGFGGSGGNGGEGMRSGGGANPTLSPFRGGCPGAGGFLLDGGVSAPGFGGGAIHLIVSDNLTLDGGVVTASGGGGAGGVFDNEGAGGGGSGGTVILEARVMNLQNGAVTANGGGGGEGGDNANGGIAGALGPIGSSTGTGAANGPGAGGTGGTGGDNAQPNGGAGNNGGGARGGGGGGGAAGVIFVKGSSCKLGNVIVSGVQGGPFMCTP